MRDILADVMRLALLWAVAAACSGCDSRTEVAIRSHRARGERALAEGRPAEAVIAFARARELAPTDADLQHDSMRARVHLAAVDPNAMRDVTEEIRYEARLLADEGDFHALVALGHLALRVGDYAQARAHYDEATRAAPDQALVHAALGKLLLRDLASRAQGKAALERALALDPNHLPTLDALADVALAEGQLARAVELYEKRLAIAEAPAIRAKLGHAFFQQKNFDAAIASLEIALRADDSDADAHHTLGLALLSSERPGRAVTHLRRAADAHPNAETMLPLAFALTSAANPEAALVVYERLLGLEPDNPLALAGAARAAEAAHRADVATAVWQRLLTLRSPRDNAGMKQLQDEARARLEQLAPTSPTP